MSLSPQDRSQLRRLLHEVRDGQLQTDDAAWLRATLLAEEEARRMYAESVWLAGAMHWMLRGGSAEAPAVRAAEIPVAAPVPVAAPAAESTVESAPRVPGRRAARSASASFYRRAVWVPLGGIAAYALYVVVITWGMFDKVARLAQEQPPAPRETPAELPTEARLTASDGAVWSNPDRHSEIRDQNSEIAEGEPLALASGTVALRLKGGVKLLIEGPAQWTIDGANHARLDSGKLLASVPKNALGFTVATPTATVVDLGTEFGVTVDRKGSTRTRVFKGEVTLQPSAQAASRQPGSAPRPATRRLTAGQAVRIDAAGNITTEQPEFATADEFIRRPGTEMPTVDPARAYSRAVLATKGLVGYWRMADDGTLGARDELEVSKARPLGRTSGRLVGFHPDDVRRPGALVGDGDYAIHFNGESYLEIDDQPCLEGDWEGLTLAAWIKPELMQPYSPDETSLIVGKWAPDPQGCAYALSYHISGRPQLAVANGRGEVVALKGAGTVWIGPQQFRFVVGTWERSSGEIHLYVDGGRDEARLQNPPRIKLNPNPYMPLLIGSQQADRSRYFTGLIDEVSVFNRALTAEEVERLYRQAIAENES